MSSNFDIFKDKSHLIDEYNLAIDIAKEQAMDSNESIDPFTHYVNVRKSMDGVPVGNYVESTSLRVTDNTAKFKIHDGRPDNILGIVLPVGNTEYFESHLVRGLVHLEEAGIQSVSTLLINFQNDWTDDRIESVVNDLYNRGWSVRYTYNKYDISKGVPINLIVEDAARLMPDAKFYHRMDDDLVLGGHSPGIDKSGGQQVVEMLHYLSNNPTIGTISTTGVLGKYPPKHYIGPHAKRGRYIYLFTNLGSMFINMNRVLPSNGCMTPNDSLHIVGALEDALAGAYRTHNGYLPVKMNYVRAKVLCSTSVSEPSSEHGWDQPDMIESGVSKYIKDNYNPGFNWRSLSADHTTDEHLSTLPHVEDFSDSKVIDRLTVYYPPNSEVDDVASHYRKLIDDIISINKDE